MAFISNVRLILERSLLKFPHITPASSLNAERIVISSNVSFIEGNSGYSSCCRLLQVSHENISQYRSQWTVHHDAIYLTIVLPIEQKLHV